MVTRRKGKNSRIAMLAGSLLTLISICLLSLGIWRLCQDLDLANNFIFSVGLLSHWQVWIAAAALTQYGCWRLTRYAKAAGPRVEHALDEANADQEESAPSGMAANV